MTPEELRASARLARHENLASLEGLDADQERYLAEAGDEFDPVTDNVDCDDEDRGD